ncbi:MAG: wax ester/triacylglycerol synthase family O-acyltransferase [Panacagrimonas sp.]|jgi:diacylglycerol O-acyltransferase|nr:wax ester/triacylglycerol synthase family O-acyltransferase [Panacagrimonas sp.]MCC2657745.1 wax ester/triacylglycerol synthase family O-acyltransferase [Panacagrimonas sp.]
MKALSPLDQAFLMLERRNQPMHVGSLMLFRPPEGFSAADIRALVEEMANVDRAEPPFDQRLTRKLALPFWTRDDEFDLSHHFRHLALPQPGRIRELLAMVSNLHSSLLDREFPLWETTFIEGVADGRFALYSKMHHAMIDGVAAVRLVERILSGDPDARGMDPPWAAKRPSRKKEGPIAGPTSALAATFGQLKAQARSWPAVTKALVSTYKQARKDPEFGDLFRAPTTIFNRRIGNARRFAAQAWPLARVKAAGKKLGGTLNDAVLGMCSSALRRYLLEQNALPKQPLITMMPMSLRRDDSDSGNQVGMVLANLGTHIADPAERLGVIKRSVAASKQRLSQMTPAEIMNYTGLISGPAGLNLATGIAPQKQLYNVVISNVPGPKQTLYWNGATLEGMYPVSIPVDGMALNITLVSYADQLNFGLTACRRSVPHVQRMLEYLEQGLVELETL